MSDIIDIDTLLINKAVNRAIRYANKLVNTHTITCTKIPKENKYPFYVANKPPPSLEIIKKNGINCAGFINLIRRHMNLEIPGIITGEKKSIFPGGTGEWFGYLKKEKRLEKIDYDKTYPKGTLLLEDYNPNNQGHLAMVYTSNKKGLLNSKIIHTRWESHIKKVQIDYFYDYTYKNEINKRFTHVCYPEDWLIKN